MNQNQTFLSFWKSIIFNFSETYQKISKKLLISWIIVYIVNAFVPLFYYLNLIGGFGDGILMCLIFTQGNFICSYISF